MTRATQTVPYFPPPPTSSAPANSRSRPKSSSLRKSKDVFPQASRPSPLHRSRTILLPFLLILTFAVFVLATIYGYCVAVPHTQRKSMQNAIDSAADLDSSIYSRSPIFVNPATSIHASNTNGTLSSTSTHSGYGSNEKLSAALIFYLLASPTLLLALLSTELVLQYACSRTLSSRRCHIMLLISHALALVGMIVSSSFWTVCELPTPHTTALEQICPAQVRGHFMYGIHEMSMAKTVIAWTVVAGMLWHTLCLLRGCKTSRREWAVSGEGHGEVQEVVFKMEEGLVMEAQAQRPERKRDWVVRFLK